MYIETGLGQAWKVKPRPKKVPAKRPPKAGKAVKDGQYRFCVTPTPGDRIVNCDLELKIKFRRSFEEFLHEVENAYGTWMDRSTARMLIKKLQKTLKELHQDMLNNKLWDNAPIILQGQLDYRRSSKGAWNADRSTLRNDYTRLIDL